MILNKWVKHRKRVQLGRKCPALEPTLWQKMLITFFIQLQHLQIFLLINWYGHKFQLFTKQNKWIGFLVVASAGLILLLPKGQIVLPVLLLPVCKKHPKSEHKAFYIIFLLHFHKHKCIILKIPIQFSRLG